MIACLKEFFPAALKFFTRIPQLCTLKFLQLYPSAESLMNASRQELINVLINLRHKSPDTKATEILEIARQPQIRVPQATFQAKSRLALVLIKQLLVPVEELDNYDKAIMQLFKTHDDAPIFAGLPGAGKRLAPKLLAESTKLSLVPHLSHFRVASTIRPAEELHV